MDGPKRVGIASELLAKHRARMKQIQRTGESTKANVKAQSLKAIRNSATEKATNFEEIFKEKLKEVLAEREKELERNLSSPQQKEDTIQVHILSLSPYSYLSVKEIEAELKPLLSVITDNDLTPIIREQGYNPEGGDDGRGIHYGTEVFVKLPIPQN